MFQRRTARGTPFASPARFEYPASRVRRVRIVVGVSTATEVASTLYSRWNENRLADLADRLDPAIELICDPLRPDESALRGVEGWQQWVARWEDTYEEMHITVDGLVPVDPEHVLALISITAKRRGSELQPLSWAAAHLWTVREGRIARWETHLDLSAARRTLDD